MNFSAAASNWLQSVDSKMRDCSWTEFCQLLLDRFGRDEHELLLRCLFNIRQTTTVSDYIDKFAKLVDQLTAYGSTSDLVCYTTKFVDGLRDDIRSAVLIQRPATWDTACVLARLQEEVANSVKRSEFRSSDSAGYSKPQFRTALPLPAPPAVPEVPVTASTVDCRGTDAARARSTDDKWAALKAYRRAQGLCQRCVEKWSRDHKCAPSVELHVLQELLEAFNPADDTISSPEVPSSPNDQLFLALSSAAVTGQASVRTLCMKGSI